MVFTFLAARGHAVGASLVEPGAIDTARKLEAAARARGVQLLLPSDVVVADAFAADANVRVVPATAIPAGWMVRAHGACMQASFSNTAESQRACNTIATAGAWLRLKACTPRCPRCTYCSACWKGV